MAASVQLHGEKTDYHTDVTIGVWIKPNILSGKQVIYQTGRHVQALASVESTIQCR